MKERYYINKDNKFGCLIRYLISGECLIVHKTHNKFCTAFGVFQKCENCKINCKDYGRVVSLEEAEKEIEKLLKSNYEEIQFSELFK